MIGALVSSVLLYQRSWHEVAYLNHGCHGVRYCNKGHEMQCCTEGAGMKCHVVPRGLV